MRKYISLRFLHVNYHHERFGYIQSNEFEYLQMKLNIYTDKNTNAHLIPLNLLYKYLIVGTPLFSRNQLSILR
jgi:hypothetical protein